MNPVIYRTRFCGACAIMFTLLLSACGRPVVTDTQTPTPLVVAGAPTGPARPFMLEGRIDTFASEQWVVAGIPVALDAQTVISGAPTAGAFVRVQGAVTADGQRQARTIIVDLAAAPALPATTTEAATSTQLPEPTTVPPTVAVPDTPAVPPTATVPDTAPTPAPLPTAPQLPTVAPLAAGTVVDISGTIQRISVSEAGTLIEVNNATYVLPPAIEKRLGKRLQPGATIVFAAQVEADGRVVIVDVSRIDDKKINLPGNSDEQGEDDQGEDG